MVRHAVGPIHGGMAILITTKTGKPHFIVVVEDWRTPGKIGRPKIFAIGDNRHSLTGLSHANRKLGIIVQGILDRMCARCRRRPRASRPGRGGAGAFLCNSVGERPVLSRVLGQIWSDDNAAPKAMARELRRTRLQGALIHTSGLFPGGFPRPLLPRTGEADCLRSPGARW